jgi:hypothetical protein
MEANISVILLALGVTVVVPQLASAPRQGLESITDPVAYAVYASVLRTAWPDSKATLLLMEETEDIKDIENCTSVFSGDPDWSAVVTRFRQENTAVRALERRLPVDFSYRIVPRAEIDADDARLALKYPGTWNRRPESMEFAAVSAVGFDSTKTKAMVYVRLRSSGQLHVRELRYGNWVVPKLKYGCGGWVI